MKHSPGLLCPLVVTVLFVAAISGTCRAAEDIVIVDFKNNPLPAGWQVEGYAFGSRKPGPDRQQAARTTPNQQQYQTGRLASPGFTLERDYLVLEIGGVCHPEKCCIALVVDGRDVRRVSPGEAGNAPPSGMDVRDLRGKQARLEVRDEHFNGWVTLGRLIQTDTPKPGAQRAIPAWEPAVFEAKIDGAFLLLPLHDVAGPMQTVTVEIDGQKKLVADMPLAMHDPANYQPIYDLTGCQGKTLRVSYHRTAESETGRLIRISSEIPKHPIADSLPAFHVHCRFGKLNDPNGLVYHDGRYHLFHQYYYGLRGKHWSHYVSTDLVHWQERPVGLFPDATGSMHSGSAAVDWHNTGGFQKGDTPAVIAAFTGSRGLGGGDKFQVQGIAYSTDGARTFAKYEGNPVLGDAHLKTLKADNSRDPKIFWFSPTRGMDPKAKDGHWVMILFEDGGHSIFTSDNLKQWKKTGCIQGFHECPELFPLAVDGNPQDIRWVMYGANGEYHIGSFDGETFKPQTETKLPFYYGRPYYAAQTFSDTPGRPPRRIQVGWQSSQISFPIELSLRTTPVGLRLCSRPVNEIANLYERTQSFDGLKLGESQANPLEHFESGLYDIEIDANVKGAKQITLVVRGKTIRYDVEKSRLSCERQNVTLPPADGRLALRVIVDHCSIDIHAGEHGAYYMPMFFGPLPSKKLELRCEGGPVTLDRLRVHELKPIWN